MDFEVGSPALPPFGRQLLMREPAPFATQYHQLTKLAKLELDHMTPFDALLALKRLREML